MSWDFNFKIDTGGKELFHIGPDWNYTSNVGRMTGHALHKFTDNGVRGLHDKNAKIVDEWLTHALEMFDENEKLYKSWNPENGWGDYDGIKRVLREMRDFARANPKTIFDLWA